MSKTSLKKKKNPQKWIEFLFYGIVIALVVLLILQAVLPSGSDSYVITEEGHVHTADGTHIGTFEEVFGTTMDAVTAGDEAAATAEPAAEPTAEPAT